MFRYLFVLILLVVSHLSYSATEDLMVSMRGAPLSVLPSGQSALPLIQNGTKLTIQDQWYAYMQAHHYVLGNAQNWDNSFRVYNSLNRVTLRYDDAFRNCLPNGERWTLQVNYAISTFDSLGNIVNQLGVTTAYNTESLSISYDPSTGMTYTDKSMNQYVGGLKANLVVTQVIYNEYNGNTQVGPANSPIIPSFLGDVYLDLEQITDRYYVFDIASGSSIYQQPPVVAGVDNLIHVSWAFMQGAESYDLEYLFVDVPLSQGTISSSPAVVDFSNATRINTTNQNYDISLGYPRGRILYRVRGVGRDALVKTSVVRAEGNWSYDPPAGTTVAQVPSNNSGVFTYYDFNGVDQGMNWQYSVSYAEDGKRKEVQSYYDGSLRNRQSLTLINSDQSVLIGETKYDYQGRAAINILPGILSGTQNRGIKYYGQYNILNQEDFDANGTYINPNALGTGSGAGQFYSGSNLNQNGVNAFIPDAQGYPYSQTSYMNDGTHRIRMQSGLGPKMKFGSGKETRYFYGTPTGPEEIDRLFGTEVGFVSHYKKNMVVDANGQVSVSYLDQEGRVIATALAGNNSGGNLLALDNIPAAQSFTSDLLGSNQLTSDGNMVATTTLPVSDPGSTYTFHYTLNGSGYTPTTCVVPNVNCLYDLEIIVTDADGNLVPYPSQISTPNPMIYTAISAVTPVTFTATFPNVGTYTVSKFLHVNQANIATVSAAFIQNQTCVTLTASTPEPCAVDCHQACLSTYFKGIGSQGDSLFINDSGKPVLSTDNSTVIWPLLTACRASLCYNQATTKNLDPCEANYNAMHGDLSPGGQYFDNLPYKYTNVGGLRVVNPNYTTYNSSAPEQYIDAWLNAHANAAGSIQDLSNINTGKSHPAFTSWEDVRKYWDIRYAHALLVFHPEICAQSYFCGSKSCGPDRVTGVNSYAYPQDSVFNFNMLMAQAVAPNVAAGQTVTSGTDNHFFNPLLMSGSSFTNGSTAMDYSNYMPSYLTYNYFVWKDPEFNPCSSPVCGMTGEAAVSTLLKKYIQIKDNNGNPVMVSGQNTYFSVWYLLDDPDHIATVNGGGGATGLDPNIVSYFNTVQNLLQGQAPVTTPPTILPAVLPTKYQLFSGIYSGIKQIYNVQNYSNFLTGDDPYANFAGQSCIDNVSDSRYSNGYLKLNSTAGSAVMGSLSPEGFVVHYPENKLLTSANFCGASPFDYQTVMSTIPHSTTSAGGNPVSGMINGAPTGVAYDQGACLANSLNDFIYSTGIDNTVPPYSTSAAAYYTDLATAMNATLPVTVPAQPVVTAQQISAWIYQANKVSPLSPLGDSLQNMPQTYLTNCAPTQPAMSQSDYMAAILAECQEESQVAATNNDNVLFQTQLNAALANYMTAYLSACMLNLDTRETFTVDYQLNEYDYTLYYYDQAGNLVKTVPPAGVNFLTTGTTPSLADVKAYRKAHPDYQSPALTPPHTMVTHYWYNSLQQQTKQYIPDGDSLWMWYDKIGRIVVSQNRRQQNEANYTTGANSAYSYITYDNLSRVIEVGKLNSATQMDYATSRETTTPGALSAWLSAANSSRTEVTSSYYDQPFNTAVNFYFGGLGQQNLRGRIATITYSATLPSPTSYDNAMHYNYDIHGNVSTVIKENNNANLNLSLASLKRTDYEYDLVSGNVNNVYYQKGHPDEFDHQYEYDADNRITKASTSRNGLIWEKEGKYFYHAHGPMSRKEVGDKEVQGMDYAYSIQGWLKGVNSTTLVGSRDMGIDGEAFLPGSGGTANNLNYSFAKDVYGYSLDYFKGDYSPIKPFTAGSGAIPTITGSCSLDNATKDLYNGNISRMVTSLTDNTLTQMDVQARAYRYDQLNRIRQVDAFTDPNVISSDNWNSTTNNNGTYYEEFHYDFNGNIQRAIRNGNQSGGNMQMDNLTYTYLNPTTNNMLDNVTNAGNPSAYGDAGLGAQGPGNYAYDEMGRLIHDYREEIGNVVWTVYGKVSRITRTINSLKSNLEFVYDANGNRIVKIEKPNFLPVNSRTVRETSQLGWIYTYYERDATGNVLAVYKRTFGVHTGASGVYEDHYKLVEHDVYGSSRLGQRNGNSADDYMTLFTASITAINNEDMFSGVNYSTTVPSTVSGNNFIRTLGYKAYEAKNHLGNVMEVFSDKRMPTAGTGLSATTVAYYQPYVLSSTDYYAFGGVEPGRNFVSSSGYRYGFNGKEKDDELKGNGDSYDFGARMYDPRIGRMFSRDRFNSVYPDLSPYNGMANNPISNTDFNGNLIIFVSGLDKDRFGGNCQTLETYWGAKLRANAAYTFHDYNAMYFSGSSGGLLRAALNRKLKGSHQFKNSNIDDRIDNGSAEAKKYALAIREELDRERGPDGKTDPNAKIHFISHSQGGAYAEGMKRFLMSGDCVYPEGHPKAGQQMFSESDFGTEDRFLSPFSPKGIDASDFKNAWQYTHSNDRAATANPVQGLDPNHFISTPFGKGMRQAHNADGYTDEAFDPSPDGRMPENKGGGSEGAEGPPEGGCL